MKLDHDRILVFFSRTDGVDEQACRSVLSPDEVKKADAFKFEKDRRLSVLARAQIRYLLSRVTGEPADAFVFSQGERGKPMVRPGTPGADISFNISHSRGMVISALGLNTPLGVDIEILDRRVDPDIARRFFSPGETRQIMAVSGEDRAALFLRFWTLKEAWAKAEGLGLAAGLDSMTFDLSDPGRICWSPPGPAASGSWQFFQFSPIPGSMAALAAASVRPLTLETYACTPFDAVLPIAIEAISS